MKHVLIDRTGEKHITKEGYQVEIIEYFNNANCTVSFENGVIINNRQYHAVRVGSLKNPYHLSVFGVGYFGDGHYKAMINYKTNKYYTTWIDMIKRCYSEEYNKIMPTYKDVTVCEEWHNFQNFAKWFEENYNPETMEGWELDKDILIQGNKIYSPETCCFVPQEINKVILGGCDKGVYKKTTDSYTCQLTIEGKTCFLGTFKTKKRAYRAYKTAKEKYIKQKADKWKDLIDPKVYNSLYKYRIELK